MTRFDLTPLFRTTVGFDRLFQLFDEMAETPTSAYPPYNIEKINENKYRISMAVAGFRPEDLEVELKQNRLTIQGRIAPTQQDGSDNRSDNGSDNGSDNQADESNESNFLHRGIAERAFSRQFSLAEHVLVEKAQLENGLLHIELLRDIPEEAKPKRIPVQTTNRSAKLQTPKSANEALAPAEKRAQSA